jgi:hypothetical protein
VQGKKGGNSIRVQSPIDITNNGIISVGGGGGGGSGGAISYSPPGVLAVCQSGSGGGGGWPYGSGGLKGQSTLDDSTQEDHTEEYNNGGLLLASSNYVGNLGQNSGAAVSVAVGGAARVGYSNTDGNPDVIVETYQAGNGAVPSLGIFSTGGGGAYAVGYAGNVYAGDGGNGGNNGDYAIHGISFVTFTTTGTIYGATS